MNNRTRQRRIRERKRRIRRLLVLEMLVVVSVVSYVCGRKAGASSVRQAAAGQTSGLLNEGQPGQYDLQDVNAKAPEHPDILLVNKENPLPEGYEDTLELKTLPDGTNRGAAEAYEPLTAMLKAGRAEGLNFEICSSYRSSKRQQELLDEDIDILMKKGLSYDAAYIEATRETMPPGYSEHATGLAFDIVALSYQMLDARQAETPENKWLQQHCMEYGFILRYPKDKEEITGISYESWHFRYVGVEAATEIMEQGITLEEYLGQVKGGII